MNRHRRAFITAAILVAASGVVAGTNASFTALTQNQAGTYSIDALTGPTGTLTITNPSNVNTLTFTWTTRGYYQSNPSGTTGFTHRVLADIGIESGGDGLLNGNDPPMACTSKDPSDYPITMATTTSATAVTVATTSGWVTSNSRVGAFGCFLVVANKSNGSIYSLGDVGNLTAGPIQLGYAITSVVAANGGVAGTIDDGDTLTLTMSQPWSTSLGIPTSTNKLDTSASSSGNSICVNATTDLMTVGRASSSGACSTSEATTFRVGQINGINFNQTATWNAQYAGLPSGCTTACTGLLVTFRGRSNGTAPTGLSSLGSTGFFTATTQSYLRATLNSTKPCVTANSATSICKPNLTGSF